MFHGNIPEGTVATWIIVLAIMAGVLILFLITMALHKVRLHLSLYSTCVCDFEDGMTSTLLSLF
jgi:hypothetical protein